MTASSPLTIATFNIKLGLCRGIDAVAEAVDDLGGFDVLAVQEIGDHWTMGPGGDVPAQLAEQLGATDVYFVPTIEKPRDDGPPARYGHALFSRHPIESPQWFDLPQNEDEPRRMLHCSIATDAGRFEVLSTHLSHLPSDRPDQGVFLTTWLAEHPSRGDARFVLGDLNATRDEPWMTGFINQFTDADAKSGRPTFPADNPERRIDYVLAQNAELLDVNVPPLTDVSDHRPVFSRWRIGT